MAFQTRNDGVIVKLPLSKFKELKENNQLADNEAYVISDIDNYLNYLMLECDENVNLFGVNQLEKTSFSTTGNSEGFFQFNIWNDETYSTWCAGADITTGQLELKYTFSLWEDKTYLIRVGLNGDVIDDKLNVYKHLETGAYTLRVVLKSNNINSCEIEYISLVRTFELPSRLNENVITNIFVDNNIDNADTGFHLWNCNNEELRPNRNNIYYYVYSNMAWNDTGRWGTQIAIDENNRQMYFRSLGDDEVWSAWKRVLNSTDDTNSLSSTEYWQVRDNRVIGNGECLFFNTSKTDFSDVPLGNLLLQEEESGSSYYIKFLQESNAYKLVWYNTDGVYTNSDIIAYGFSRSNMIWSKSYWQYTHETSGDYVKISQVIEDHDLIDNLMRINNTGF